MLLQIGEKCPAFDYWDVDIDYHCKHCRGNRGIFSNGIDCGFSKIPTCEPKFNIGELVYGYPGLQNKIRKREWDGRFEWVYYFARERTPRSEKKIFRTRKEYDEYRMMEKVKELSDDLKIYCERYNLVMGSELKKMLQDVNK